MFYRIDFWSGVPTLINSINIIKMRHHNTGSRKIENTMYKSNLEWAPFFKQRVISAVVLWNIFICANSYINIID